MVSKLAEIGEFAMAYPAPFVGRIQQVEDQWTDYNGHFNMAYYNVLFDRAGDEAFAAVGLGPDYVKERNASFFTLESHNTYVRELHAGDSVRIETQFLDCDAKRVHYVQQMFHATEGWLSCVTETDRHACRHGPQEIRPLPARRDGQRSKPCARPTRTCPCRRRWATGSAFQERPETRAGQAVIRTSAPLPQGYCAASTSGALVWPLCTSHWRRKVAMIISKDIWNVSTGVELVRNGNDVTLTLAGSASGYYDEYLGYWEWYGWMEAEFGTAYDYVEQYYDRPMDMSLTETLTAGVATTGYYYVDGSPSEYTEFSAIIFDTAAVYAGTPASTSYSARGRTTGCQARPATTASMAAPEMTG